MTSTESIKYIIPAEGKKAIKEGLIPVKKIYQILINLNKANLNKEYLFTVNNGECDTTLTIHFLTHVKDEQFHIITAYSPSSTSPYSIAVLEYVSKYLTKSQKKNSDFEMTRVCNGCGLLHITPCKKCVCRMRWYCSKECQKSDWNKHKTDCKQICAQL